MESQTTTLETTAVTPGQEQPSVNPGQEQPTVNPAQEQPTGVVWPARPSRYTFNEPPPNTVPISGLAQEFTGHREGLDVPIADDGFKIDDEEPANDSGNEEMGEPTEEEKQERQMQLDNMASKQETRQVPAFVSQIYNSKQLSEACQKLIETGAKASAQKVLVSADELIKRKCMEQRIPEQPYLIDYFRLLERLEHIGIFWRQLQKDPNSTVNDVQGGRRLDEALRQECMTLQDQYSPQQLPVHKYVPQALTDLVVNSGPTGNTSGGTAQAASAQPAPAQVAPESAPATTTQPAAPAQGESADQSLTPLPEPKVIPIRDESDGRTTKGRVVLVIPFGGRGHRVIVDRGVERCPHYEIYAGSEFGADTKYWAANDIGDKKHSKPVTEKKGSAVKKHQIADFEQVVKRECSKRTHTYFMANEKDRLTGQKSGSFLWASKSDMVSVFGQKRMEQIEKDLLGQREERLGVLDACQRRRIHPRTKQPLTEEQLKDMPWLAPEEELLNATATMTTSMVPMTATGWS